MLSTSQIDNIIIVYIFQLIIRRGGEKCAQKMDW